MLSIRQAAGIAVAVAVAGVLAAGLELDDAAGDVSVPRASPEPDPERMTTAARPDGTTAARPPALVPCDGAPAVALCLGWQRPRAHDQLLFADAGSVYLGGAGGTLTALDRATGEVRWDTTAGVGQLVEGAVGSGQLVVAGTDGRSAGDAVAGLDLRDGQVLWRAPAGTAVEPVGADDAALLFEADRLRHLDARTGEERWSRATTDPAGFQLVPGTTEAPVVSSDRVLTALELGTGAARWELALPQLRGAAAAGDDRIIAVDGGGRLVGIDARSGAADWTSRLAFDGRSAVRVWAADDLALVAIDPPLASDGTRTPRIVDVDPESGEVRWVHLYRSAVERRGIVLAPPATAILVGTTGPGTVAALDLATGRIAWQKDLGSDPAHVRVLGDTVLAASGRDVALLSAADGSVQALVRGASPVIGIVAADEGGAILKTTTTVVAVTWPTGG